MIVGVFGLATHAKWSCAVKSGTKMLWVTAPQPAKHNRPALLGS
jgi:hypothetical protein